MNLFQKIMSHFEEVDPNEQRSSVTTLLETPDETGYFRRRDIRENKNAATMAYFPFLGLLSIFQAKRSPYVRYHMNQALILLILEVIWWISEVILSSIFNQHSLYFLTILLALLNLIPLYLIFKGMKNASQGIAKELPLIGHHQLLP